MIDGSTIAASQSVRVADRIIRKITRKRFGRTSPTMCKLPRLSRALTFASVAVILDCKEAPYCTRQ